MKKGARNNDIFKTNPEKAVSRISINSFMLNGLFVIFSLIWTLNPSKFNRDIIAQMVIAIPMLFVSSLAYSKVGYWKETALWDALGWVTNNLGNIAILNIIGLMTASIDHTIALIYFGITLLLMILYSAINIRYKPSSLKEKVFKFSFFVFFLFLGGILPII